MCNAHDQLNILNPPLTSSSIFHLLHQALSLLRSLWNSSGKISNSLSPPSHSLYPLCRFQNPTESPLSPFIPKYKIPVSNSIISPIRKLIFLVHAICCKVTSQDSLGCPYNVTNTSSPYLQQQTKRKNSIITTHKNHNKILQISVWIGTKQQTLSYPNVFKHQRSTKISNWTANTSAHKQSFKFWPPIPILWL